MSDQIKSYYSNPGRRLQYENWKYRNDSKQLISSIKWDPKNNSNFVSSISSTNPYFKRSPVPSKTKLKNTIVSNGFQRKNSCMSILDRKNPQIKSVKNYCLDFKKPALNNDSKSNVCYKIDERNDRFGSIFSDCEFSSDEYSSNSYENELFLNQIEPNDLEELQKFRDEFYFECHSLETKLSNYRPAEKHVCQHQFSINDRLFPEPLYADHLKNSRCRICHLPLSTRKDESTSDVNEDISRRVKFSEKSLNRKGSDTKTKSKIEEKESPEIVLRFPYDKFKSIAIDQNFPTKLIDVSSIANKSVIKSTKLYTARKREEAPSDSLALRYQKGYKKK